MLVQIVAIEQQQSNDATADGSICKVEDWTEKDEAVATNQRHPVGPIGINDREIEHVDHTTVEEGCVAFSPLSMMFPAAPARMSDRQTMKPVFMVPLLIILCR